MEIKEKLKNIQQARNLEAQGTAEKLMIQLLMTQIKLLADISDTLVDVQIMLATRIR